MKVYKGDEIQIAGGFLANGMQYDGFSAIAEFQSSFNTVENWWEVCFSSENVKGVAIFNEELQMWDIIEEESEGTLFLQN